MIRPYASGPDCPALSEVCRPGSREQLGSFAQHHAPAHSPRCAALRCRIMPYLDQGGAATRRRVRRSPRRALPWKARPARPRRPSCATSTPSNRSKGQRGACASVRRSRRPGPVCSCATVPNPSLHSLTPTFHRNQYVVTSLLLRALDHELLYSEYQRITRKEGKTGDSGISENYISRSASKNRIYKGNSKGFSAK